MHDVTSCLVTWSHVHFGGLCPWSHVPPGGLCQGQGVSVQEEGSLSKRRGLCPEVGVFVQEEDLCQGEGVSVQGRGLSPVGSLSTESLSRGIPVVRLPSPPKSEK